MKSVTPSIRKSPPLIMDTAPSVQFHRRVTWRAERGEHRGEVQNYRTSLISIMASTKRHLDRTSPIIFMASIRQHLGHVVTMLASDLPYQASSILSCSFAYQELRSYDSTKTIGEASDSV